MAVESLLVHSGDARQAIDAAGNFANAVVDLPDVIGHLAEPQGNLTEKLLVQLELACDLIKLRLKPPSPLRCIAASGSKLFLRATRR